jgi:hypothetical protein
MDTIRAPIDEIFNRAVAAINSKGFHFEKAPDEIGLWKDQLQNLELDITALLTVSCTEEKDPAADIDEKQKKIEDKFYELAEKGDVKDIRILSSFEADIANGGFEQLYDNKGLEFIKEAISILENIGARTKMRLSVEACDVIGKYAKTINQFQAFQKALFKIDSRYDRSKENIPLLYHKKVGI